MSNEKAEGQGAQAERAANEAGTETAGVAAGVAASEAAGVAAGVAASVAASETAGVAAGVAASETAGVAGVAERLDEDGLPLDRDATIDDVRSKTGLHGRIGLGCVLLIVLLVTAFWLWRGGMVG